MRSRRHRGCCLWLTAQLLPDGNAGTYDRIMRLVSDNSWVLSCGNCPFCLTILAALLFFCQFVMPPAAYGLVTAGNRFDAGNTIGASDPSHMLRLADKSRRYEWLFGPQSEPPVQDVKRSTGLESFDNEVKQARKLYLSGDPDKAILKYRSAVDQLESLIDAAPPGHSVLDEMEKRFTVFDELAVKILGPMESEPRVSAAGQLFHVLEKRRICRKILTVKKAGLVEFFDVPAGLLEEEAQLLTRLVELRQNPTASAKTSDEEALKSRLASVRASLRKSSQRYALLRSGQPAPLRDVQEKLLGQEDLILDFNLLRDRMIVGIITRESAAYHQIHMNRSDIDKGVFALQEKLREFSLGEQSTFMGHAWKERCRRLYRILLGVLPPLPQGKKTVFVIPDRSLWYLPMSVLLDDEDRPFGRDRIVSLIPSAEMLRFIRAKTSAEDSGARAVQLLLVESLPWVSEKSAEKIDRSGAARRKKSAPMSEGERIQRLILGNPVYPKPSEIVVKIHKMFRSSVVRVGPAATADAIADRDDHRPDLSVIAVPLAVTDRVTSDRGPEFFFSPGKEKDRQFSVSGLFSSPLGSKLTVLPTCWYDVEDKASPAGEGPLLLSMALIYSGTGVGLVNYSNPDWGSDDPFLLHLLEKVSQGSSPWAAISSYTREMPGGLASPFSGKPPSWSGWLIIGDPGQ